MLFYSRLDHISSHSVFHSTHIIWNKPDLARIHKSPKAREPLATSSNASTTTMSPTAYPTPFISSIQFQNLRRPHFVLVAAPHSGLATNPSVGWRKSARHSVPLGRKWHSTPSSAEPTHAGVPEELASGERGKSTSLSHR